MTEPFRLLMLSAMYENGGNTTHRFLDGHPDLFVYPFESQVGTRLVNDALSAMYPVKYRWPVFDLDATPYADFKAIIDEECKVRARTPHVSKFRDRPFALDDDERCRAYEAHARRLGRSTAHNIEAFFRATFEAWTDHASSGRESVYVGYSPIIAIDAERIVADCPGAHVLHVVRNPWSAYADTKKRPVPLSLEAYMLGWTTVQQRALVARTLHPGRVHILRLEDVLADPAAALAPPLGAMGLAPDPALGAPSWNGTPMAEVYPWGTIRTATSEANEATAAELTDSERQAISARAVPLLDPLGYEPRSR